MDRRKAVEEMARGLDKPTDARTMQQIAEMQKCLSVMTQMSSELNSMSQADALGLAGHMGFISTG